MLSLLFLLPSFLYLINSFAIDLSFHKKSSTVIMSSENKFPLKTESPVPSSSPKTNKRNRQDEMLSPSNPDFDVATGKFLSKDALFEVQKLFVLDGSRRVRRKVKEIKAEIITKERDPKGPTFTDELEATVENVERALKDAGRVISYLLIL